MQVRQATLPFGPPALVYDPLTYTYTAPYKQILRVRLLLNQINKNEVCTTMGRRIVRPTKHAFSALSAAHPLSHSVCLYWLCAVLQWTGGVVTINQSERCLPEYLITFK